MKRWQVQGEKIENPFIVLRDKDTCRRRLGLATCHTSTELFGASMISSRRMSAPQLRADHSD
jgi:hypothetical protein